LSPYILPSANASGDAATPNTGTFFGYGFTFNASATNASTICPLDGSAPISVPAQGTQQPPPLTLVLPPMAAVCTGCHDSNLAISHMEVNGGKFYRARSTLPSQEQCLVCHSSGKTADTKVVHKVGQ